MATVDDPVPMKGVISHTHGLIKRPDVSFMSPMTRRGSKIVDKYLAAEFKMASPNDGPNDNVSPSLDGESATSPGYPVDLTAKPAKSDLAEAMHASQERESLCLDACFEKGIDGIPVVLMNDEEVVTVVMFVIPLLFSKSYSCFDACRGNYLKPSQQASKPWQVSKEKRLNLFHVLPFTNLTLMFALQKHFI